MEPFAANLKFTVKKMLNAAGYELPAAEVESNVKKGITSRSAELQLDSTVTFYNYDPSASMDSVPLFKTVFTYPSDTEELQVESVFENGIWIPLNRTALTFDNLARVVEAYSEVFDPGTMTWMPDSKIKVYPRGSSDILVDSFFVQGWSADLNSWLELVSVWNSYDASDRLTVSLTLFDLFGQPLLFKDVHSYDFAGDNTLIESYLIDGAVEIPAGKKNRIYFEHHLEKELGFLADGAGGFEPQYQHIFTFNSLWKVANEAFYNWDADSSKWWIEEAVFYEYDGEERLISKETQRSTQDGGVEPQLVTYEYEEGEYLALETNYTYDFSIENYVLSDRKYFYYKDEISSAPQEPVTVRPLIVYPNPANSFVQLKLEGTASVQIFDMNGRLVQFYGAWPGEATLDVTMLPAGMYQVRALIGRETFVGKIVKQ